MTHSTTPKLMDSRVSRKIRFLLRGCPLDEFVKMVHEIPLKDFPSQELAKEAFHQLAPILYQEQYVAYVPHALAVLVVSLQAARFLPDSEKQLPLIQALWLAGEEKKSPVFPEQDEAAYRNGNSTLQGLAEALAAKDFNRAYGIARHLLSADSTRDSCRSALILASLRDIANMGHKFLYMAKTMEFLEILPDAHTGKVILPALHHLVFGSSDTGYFSLLQTKLKNFEGGGTQFIKNEGLITEDEAKRLEHVLVYQYPGLIIENLVYELQQGISADEIFQVILSAASQALLGAFRESWLYPVHGYNFAHECWEGFRRMLDPGEKINFLFMAAMFVNKMAVKSMDPHKMIKFEEVNIAGHEESLAGLEKAVEASQPEVAGALAVKLLDKVDFTDLARTLMRTASKNDSGVCAGHDLKLAFHVLFDYSRMRIGLKFKPVAALAYFLAQVEKDYDLFKALSA